MPWARCLKEAETGEVDGVFSSFKLPERERFLAFSKEALTIQVIVFFARRESTQSFDGDLAAVRDVKIGVITGTSTYAGAAYYNELRTHRLIAFLS
jgi:polar amino acid transport system substrate-binding protein